MAEAGTLSAVEVQLTRVVSKEANDMILYYKYAGRLYKMIMR